MARTKGSNGLLASVKNSQENFLTTLRGRLLAVQDEVTSIAEAMTNTSMVMPVNNSICSSVNGAKSYIAAAIQAVDTGLTTVRGAGPQQ